MSVYGAHLEPYSRNGEVWILMIKDGTVEHIDSREWWNKDRFSHEEQKLLIEAGTEYRWRLPTRIDLNEDVPALPEIHGHIIQFLKRYVWFSNDDMYDVAAAWVISTYFRDQFTFAPILIFDGITNTGKTTALMALEMIAYRGYKSSNNSAASLAREIEDHNLTILIDEAVDNLQSDRGSDLCSLIKSAWEPSSTWIRADPKGRKNYVYHVYTNIALAVKGVGLPEDVYNRGLRIGMAGMPDDIVLEDIYSCAEDDTSGPSSPVEIRNALYTLKMLTMLEPRGSRAVDMGEHIRNTRRHMTQRCENGQWLYSYILDLPEDSPQIKNRNRNIAATLYSIGLATGTERPIIRAIIRNEEVNKEVQADTEEVLIFVAFLELIKLRAADMNLVFDNSVCHEQFCKIVKGINTTDIAREYNDLLLDTGNAGREAVATKTVTAKLSALGLAYRRGAQRRSWMDPTDPLFARTFYKYVRAYSPSDTDRFSGILDEQKSDTGEPKVKKKSLCSLGRNQTSGSCINTH